MSAPLRTCVGCRARCVQPELLRAVLVGSRLVPDPTRRLPGRGAWIHPATACLMAAQRRRSWPRALRATGPVEVEELALYVARHPAHLR